MGAIPKPQEITRLEEKLGNGARRARVDFPFKIIEIGLLALSLWMGFRIGRNADLKIGNTFEARDQIRCVGVTAVMGAITIDTRRRIAAQRDDMSNSRLPILDSDFINFTGGGTNTG